MTARTAPVTLTPLLGFPEVREGDNIAGLLLKMLQDNEIRLLNGDILVISSKVVSKAMGLREPARELADVVLSQSVRVVAERMTPGGVTRIVESAAGPVMAAAGVDASNTGSNPADPATVLILPEDPDAVAAEIRRGLETGWATLSGTPVVVGVVLSDTAGRPWRIGQVDFALGAAGLRVLEDLRGSADADGRTLAVTERCVADEIAAAADLVKNKATRVPAAHVRGLGRYVPQGDGQEGEPASGARDLVRTGTSDWFAFGAVEAVRAALGVEPGSATAAEVGIPTIGPEDRATRASRALRVALLTCPDVSGSVDGDTIRLLSADDFALGVAATRAVVALRGEGLAATLTRVPLRTRAKTAQPAQDDSLTAQASVLIVCQ